MFCVFAEIVYTSKSGSNSVQHAIQVILVYKVFMAIYNGCKMNKYFNCMAKYDGCNNRGGNWNIAKTRRKNTENWRVQYFK